MTRTTVLGLITALSAIFVNSCAGEYNGTLRLVNVVFRHGQRTPADTYPADPYFNFDFHPYGWGQLTNEGKMQQFLQGQFLRQRYNEFLGSQFNNEMVEVVSTGKDRTIMSAQLELAGLFPPVGADQWNNKLNWQPIPVHYQPLDEDSLLLVRVPCPRYYEELQRVKSTGEVAQYLNSLKPLFLELSNVTNSTVGDPDDVQSLYNTLLGEELFNLTLPEWTKLYYPEPMASVTSRSFLLNVYNDELKKLKGGPLLKKILKDIKTKTEPPLNKRKMYVYGGHDSTIVNLMMALNIWDEQIPVYNIMSIIELHEEKNVFGIKVFLRNSTDYEPYLLTIPGCQSFCPLSTVMELTKDVIPENFEEECRSHNSKFQPPPPPSP